MHCQLMELFKSKESFKEKVDAVNNWKTAMAKNDCRVTSIL